MGLIAGRRVTTNFVITPIFANDVGKPAARNGGQVDSIRPTIGVRQRHRVVGLAGQSLNALESENNSRALRLELSGAR